MEENLLPAQPVMETEPKQARPWLKIALFSFLGVLIAAGLVFAGIQIGNKQNQSPVYPTLAPPLVANPTPLSTVIPTQTLNVTLTSILTPNPNPIANWKTFRLQTVNIEFKLPPQISDKNWEEKLFNGDKGKILCFQVIDISSGLIKTVFAGGAMCGSRSFTTLVIGGTSIDFEAGRGGGFTDLQGFEKTDGKYYANFVSGKQFEIPSELVRDFDNLNGLARIKIRGKNNSDSGLPISGTPGEGYLGAIINTGNQTYPGLAAQLKLNEGISEDIFNQILSTFRFLE